ncbi:uncharacterized protein LOC132692308 isoform X2 [Panthera onca]
MSSYSFLLFSDCSLGRKYTAHMSRVDNFPPLLESEASAITFRKILKSSGERGHLCLFSYSVWISQKPHQMSNEGHFQAGAGTSGYFGDLMKRNMPNSTGLWYM